MSRLHQCDQGSPLGFLKSQAYPSAVLSNQLQEKSKLPLADWADFERGTAMRLTRNFLSEQWRWRGWKSKDAYTMGKSPRWSAGGGNSVDLCAGRGCEQQSGKSHHQHAVVWRKSGEGFRNLSQSLSAACRKTGGLATAKHFPGHGDTTADSHIDLPVVTLNARDWRS